VNPQHYRELLEENLKNHWPELRRQLQSEGNLESYLSETSEEAHQAFNRQVRELKKLNPEPEGFLERVSWLRQIYQAADEFVRLNLIQLPDSDTEKAIQQGGYRD
jgi:hypothetical protein